jgi:cellulose 1,4-beta-cellobiosidase
MLLCTSTPVKSSIFPESNRSSSKFLTIDIGHAGWLGWPANLGPAAELYANVYKTANKPASMRGLATNVANYNGWSLSTCPSYTSGNSNCDEKKYINALGPLLKTAGWDAHFITDTGMYLENPLKQRDINIPFLPV